MKNEAEVTLAILAQLPTSIAELVSPEFDAGESHPAFFSSFYNRVRSSYEHKIPR